MSDVPIFRVRTKARTDTWFDPANDHTTIGFEDRPVSEEICLGYWEESHGVGYTKREIVIPYQALPTLYDHLNEVLANAVIRIADQIDELEAEADEYKAALHKADLKAYMEIFTRRAVGQP